MTDLARLRKLVTTNDSTPDAELLDRFVTARDESAFAALVHRHGPMVLGTCRRVLQHRQDAEDAFQATFLVLARRAGSINPRSLVGNWLYGVACRTASAARRMASARRTREVRAAGQRAEEVLDDARLTPELRDALDRELAALPAVYRAAVVACDLEGLSRREAAARLGWTEGTLSSRLARGRALLARRLSRYGLVVPVAGLTAPAVVATELAGSTIRQGVLMAFGKAVVAVPVAALVEGMMRTMSLAKLKTMVVTAVLTVAVTAVGTAGWRANAVVAAPPKGADISTAPSPKLVRNPDKERIAELERECERIRFRWAEAQAEAEALNKYLTRLTAEIPMRGTAPPKGSDAATVPSPRLVVRNPDQERIAELERECDNLRKEIQAGRAEAQALMRYVERAEAEKQLQRQRAADARATHPVVRVYPVGDLAGDEKQGASLVKVVRATVEPKSWDGDASIEYLPVKQLLVVRQSSKGHEEVAELLKLLSSQQEPKRPAPSPPGGR